MDQQPATVTGQRQLSGLAAGVPFVALPPAGGRKSTAPLVLAWHLLDPPRTEAAFAAAVPLAGLDAWRVYLGLPMTGARLPEGGFEELMQRGAEDAVLRVYKPITYAAVEELPAALAALRQQLELEPNGVGVVGGSLGAAVAQLSMAEGQLDARAAVLISPLVQLRSATDVAGRQYGAVYPWTNESLAVAERLDFLARADELAAAGADMLLVVGADDEPEFREPAAQLHARLRSRSQSHTDFATVPGMAHALADEPGTHASAQLPHAVAVDALAVEWLHRHLVERTPT